MLSVFVSINTLYALIYIFHAFDVPSVKKQKIDEINDLCGLRLIVLNEKDCCDAQRIDHHLWQGVPGESKDYTK
ncbi:hypothetical protein SUGI_0030890 [Cryptomeria japonica]|nr:hypothetical protein SUGI_0030890 [Cryptomeria japonica]